MNPTLPADPRTERMDKRALQQAVAEQNALMGFVKDPDATAEKAQALLRTQGIRPEDNSGSREIVAAREAE